MRYDTLQGWLDWLETSHPLEIELGLERVGRVAKTMSLTLDDCQVVTIAGTNGKGSCVASLNSLLLSAGLKVACFTSPHFIDYNERILIDNKPVTDSLIIAAFDRIDQARSGTSLSYFEFGTLAALDIFQRSGIDVAILEVGLGGRLDAVNIIDADIAVVTSIDIDHQHWLGSDREQIAREKAGIFRSGKPALSAGHQPPESLQNHASNIGAKWFQAGVEFDDLSENPGSTWCWRGQDRSGKAVELPGLPALRLPRESVSAAIQVVQLLDVPNHLVDYQSLGHVTLPGRFQSLSLGDKQLILDVAHNPAAAEYLAKQLQLLDVGGKCFAMVAIMRDKDAEGIIAPLKASFDGWFAVQLDDVPRAMPAQQLADSIRLSGINDVEVSGSVEQTLVKILNTMAGIDRLVVFGSFFTVAEVMKIYRSGISK